MIYRGPHSRASVLGLDSPMHHPWLHRYGIPGTNLWEFDTCIDAI